MDDDISSLLVAPTAGETAGRPGLGPVSTPTRFAQGTVLSWDPDTAGNEIEVHGVTLRNLPVIGSTDILVTRPGDRVIVQSSAPSGGAATYWIAGRLVIPNTDAVERSIEFLRTDLAKQISAQIFAERISSATEVLPGDRPVFSTFGDLELVGSSTPSPGPAVMAEISDARRALVFLTAQITAPAPIQGGGDMSVEITGSSTIAPSQAFRSLSTVLSDSNGGTTLFQQATAIALITESDGLNAGPNVFTAKYQDPTGTAPAAQFANRNITVIAF